MPASALRASPLYGAGGVFVRRGLDGTFTPTHELERRELVNLKRNLTHSILKRLDPRDEFSDRY